MSDLIIDPIIDQLIGQLIGPYRVTKKIGQGGMGAVYEAVHQTIERRVAIKVLKPELASKPTVSVRFINEARAVNLVNHPGLVQISDYGQLPDGTAYIVMELLEGETLGRRMLRNGGRLPVDQILRLVRQVTSALAAAHQKQIVHRDLKPDNIMMVQETDADEGERERVKLLDFGIAKVSSAPQGVDKEQTMADTVLGSPEYMSPEQCRGATEITDRADIYSLGVIMYRMLCGRLPFYAPAGSALLAMHIYEQPPKLTTLLPEVPEPLAELVHRMLAKTAAERPSAQQVFATADELALMLGMSMSSQSLSARRSDMMAAVSGAHRISAAQRLSSTLGTANGQTGDQPGRTWTWTRARLGGVVVALGALSVVTATVFWRRPQPADSRSALSQPMRRPPADLSAAGAAERAAKSAEDKLRPMWTIDSAPAGAQVVRDADGVVLGVTPWHGEQPPSSGPMAVRLRLSGYSERKLTLQPGADVSYSPTLHVKGRHGHGKLNDPPDAKAAAGPPPKSEARHGQPEIAD